MPLILAPYTLGTQLGVAAPTPTGGAYSYRKHRFLSYMAAVFACVWILGC
jgi:hypothetical protein